MTVQEMPHVEYKGGDIAQIRQHVSATAAKSYKELVCRVRVGEVEEEDQSNVDYVLALAGDDFQPRRLATLGVEHIEGQEDRGHLMVHVESDTIRHNGALLGVVCQAALEHAGVTSAFIRPEQDSDIPAATLRQAGAIALDGGSFEFRAAA